MNKGCEKNSLALIGAGNWGRHLARNFFQLGVLHTVCDINEAQLNFFKLEYPTIRLNSDYRKILENPAITKIAIAAPSQQHYTLAKQALLAGKDVYVEKPLTLDFGESRELDQISDASKRVLMVGHILHYHPSIICLKEMVRQGQLGEIDQISANRLNAGNNRREEGVLWDLGPHDVSIILSLIDQPIHSLSCESNVNPRSAINDTIKLCLTFANRILAEINLSYLHPLKEQKMMITGSKGKLIFDDIKPWNEKLTFYQNNLNDNFNVMKPSPTYVTHPIHEPLKAECVHFLECCNRRVPPQTGGKEAMNVIEILNYAQQSLDQNGCKFTFNGYAESSLLKLMHAKRASLKT